LSTPAPINAQSGGKATQNSTTPIGLPPVINIAKPIQWGGHGVGNGILDNLLFNLSAWYDFLNERSRVNGISSNSESAAIDLTITVPATHYTTFDISYLYSNVSGSSPSGQSETANQHLGSLGILQPLDWIWDTQWTPPAYWPSSAINCQSAAILSAGYGYSFTSLETPHTAPVRGSAYPFLGNVLYDFQLAWFRENPDIYPNLLFEYASGLEFSDLRIPSSQLAATTSPSSQGTYRNLCSLTYSFRCRWGILASVEWDAPLWRGGQASNANTAIFTGGLVYNLYANQKAGLPNGLFESLKDSDRWSLRLLYSYKAFDPLLEANQLQVQVSFAF
jgi:hypothetical protein